MSANQYNNQGYSITQPLTSIFIPPIVSNRAPTTADKAPIGAVWVNKSTNTYYVETSVVGNVATWVSNGGGGAGTFSSLTVTLGPISLTGTTTINTTGAATTSIGTGGTGAVNIGNTTGNTAVTGTLTSSAGITATTGNIVATAGNINATAGSISAGTTITAGTGLTVTTGNATITDGNLVLSTAASFISLPGPVFIYSGAGAPASGLALHTGDLYINTTAATTTTRLYIATGAGAWTYFTSNA